MASGKANVECASHSVQNVPLRCQDTKIFSSGSRVTWMGTICSAKMARNSTLRPGKLTQANAYAARAASDSGMSTEGMQITSEFTKNCARLTPPSEPKTAL